jgi:hypothetical protein
MAAERRSSINAVPVSDVHAALPEYGPMLNELRLIQNLAELHGRATEGGSRMGQDGLAGIIALALGSFFYSACFGSMS